MGRFHRHDDGTVHEHDHDREGHSHDHAGHEHSHDHEHSHSHEHDLADSPVSAEYGDHSSYETGVERVTVLERIFDENDHAAAHNRDRLTTAGVAAVNLMSSPGSGKTTLLQATLEHLDGKLRAGVIEGDIETALDAERLEGHGAQIALLNTANGFGGECHLDAPMVANAIDRLDLGTLDMVFIENVGNLVCPAEFEVGAHRRAMICSVTEGEDKPLKYPVMFRTADIILINKIDLLPYLDYDLDLFESNVRKVNPHAPLLRLSAKTGEGLDAWFDWLANDLAPAASAPAPATAVHPA